MLANRVRMGVVTDKYVLATDADFSGESDGDFRYIGTDEYVVIPHVIKGVNVTRYINMFRDTSESSVEKKGAEGCLS